MGQREYERAQYVDRDIGEGMFDICIIDSWKLVVLSDMLAFKVCFKYRYR